MSNYIVYTLLILFHRFKLGSVRKACDMNFNEGVAGGDLDVQIKFLRVCSAKVIR